MPRKKPGIFGSTLSMLHKLTTQPVKSYTRAKDTVRTLHKAGPSEEGRQFYVRHIRKLLGDMGIKDKLKKSIFINVKSAITTEELSRTHKLLTVLHKHKLQGEAANQFFLGGHFKIADGGALYKELRALRGAERRFSSHFAKTRIEEQGISAGRILPEVLFIISEENGVTYSHFQAEASPWRQVPGAGWRNWIPGLQTLQNSEHVYDSILYFAAKQVAQWKKDTIHNRSNYGWSPYADNNPITSMRELPKAATESAELLAELIEADVTARHGPAKKEPEERIENEEYASHSIPIKSGLRKIGK